MATVLSETFEALLKEAQFTKEMLGIGATQIRKANYATKGTYFLALTSLSTGLERIGKLCLMIDHYVQTGGEFPDFDYLRKEICHNLALIYEKSKYVIKHHAISFTFLKGLDDTIHRNILQVLSDFAEGDRYSNINLLVGRKKGNDPVAAWFEKVDKVIFDSSVPDSRKSKISNNARIVEQMIGDFTSVCHTSETGDGISGIQEASYQTGFYEAVAPHRQLFVLQIVRYWVELLLDLQYKAMSLGKQDIPFFGEIFAPFYNDDSYLKTRKTWDKI